MKLPLVNSLRQGFTMIELLVVIAVIGVLSVAVLSSINPIEQINKGRDTRSRSDAAQLISAVDRYFSIHEIYPWNNNNPPDYVNNIVANQDYKVRFWFNFPATGGRGTSDATGLVLSDQSDWAWAHILTDESEVKNAFLTRIEANSQAKTFVTKDAGANTNMYVCFQPTSFAFASDAKKRCATAETDYPAEACPTNCTSDPSDTANVCWVCLP
jgi:prepilin-type N-terminal cleavage/methylation domain-containing protein